MVMAAVDTAITASMIRFSEYGSCHVVAQWGEVDGDNGDDGNSGNNKDAFVGCSRVHLMKRNVFQQI